MRGYVSQVNRIKKAEKIVIILEEKLKRPLQGLRILDIGTGNGEMANYFAAKGNEVYSVDVQNLVDDKEILFKFMQVKSEELPFENDFFDVVISNHVIEHVEDGYRHLREIKRVLKLRGGYAT